MSSITEFNDKRGPQHDHEPLQLNIPASEALVVPSSELWEQSKDSLIDLFLNHRMTAKELAGMMRNSKYRTTTKMVRNHLHRWGVRRYTTTKEKKALWQQLLDDNASGQQWPLLSHDTVRKLRKYGKKKGDLSESDKVVLNLLRDLEINSAISSDEPLDNPEEENQAMFTDLDQWFVVNTPQYLSMFPQNPISGSPSEYQDIVNADDELDNESTSSDEEADIQDDLFLTEQYSHPNLPPDTIIRQPSHFNNVSRSMQHLGNLSKQYYHIKLQEHLLCLQGLHSLAREAVPVTNDFIQTLSQNREFWTKVKSGIYYLKKQSDSLAWPELETAVHLIPTLCQKQPFSLLKDLYATISPTATRIRPFVRAELLRIFRNHAVTKLGPNHVFSEICRILYTEECPDEISMTVLQAMLDESKAILPPEDPEIFELQRTLIRLYRRNKEFVKAEGLALTLIESSESLHDKTHVNCRLALTEYVYILNDQRRYNEALNSAEDVVDRAKQLLGRNFPDERSIYAMEDVAEICDKLGMTDKCIMWLRIAMRGAVTLLGNHAATMHILDKLEAVHDKRYQQFLSAG